MTKMIRAGTDRAKVFRMADGTRTMKQIAPRLKNKDPRVIPTILACIRRSTGIGYEYTDDGRPRVLLPEGKTWADFIER